MNYDLCFNSFLVTVEKLRRRGWFFCGFSNENGFKIRFAISSNDFSGHGASRLPVIDQVSELDRSG